MASSFSNLVDNLGEEINKFKGKYEDNNKKYENIELNSKIASTAKEYTNVKDY